MTAAIAMTAFLLALTPWVMIAIPAIKAFKRTGIAASAKPLIVTGLAVILASYIIGFIPLIVTGLAVILASYMIGFIISFAERVADLPDVISIGDALSNSAYIAGITAVIIGGIIKLTVLCHTKPENSCPQCQTSDTLHPPDQPNYCTSCGRRIYRKHP